MWSLHHQITTLWPFCGVMNSYSAGMWSYCGVMHSYSAPMWPYCGIMLSYYADMWSCCGVMHSYTAVVWRTVVFINLYSYRCVIPSYHALMCNICVLGLSNNISKVLHVAILWYNALIFCWYVVLCYIMLSMVCGHIMMLSTHISLVCGHTVVFIHSNSHCGIIQ
jgi:hypothetical protein